MQAIQGERALAAGGDLRGGSNVGQGQIKAADYVIVPDLVSSNNNAGGHHFGAIAGGLMGHAAGAAVGGMNTKKKTADVVLTVTDVRSSDEVAIAVGDAKKTDI